MFKAYTARESGAPFEVLEYDPGELGVEEVEIEVAYCGLCHSDLSIWKNEWGISSYPLVPGHEVVGSQPSLPHRTRKRKQENSAPTALSPVAIRKRLRKSPTPWI